MLSAQYDRMINYAKIQVRGRVDVECSVLKFKVDRKSNLSPQKSYNMA